MIHVHHLLGSVFACGFGPSGFAKQLVLIHEPSFQSFLQILSHPAPNGVCFVFMKDPPFKHWGGAMRICMLRPLQMKRKSSQEGISFAQGALFRLETGNFEWNALDASCS